MHDEKGRNRKGNRAKTIHDVRPRGPGIREVGSAHECAKAPTDPRPGPSRPPQAHPQEASRPNHAPAKPQDPWAHSREYREAARSSDPKRSRATRPRHGARPVPSRPARTKPASPPLPETSAQARPRRRPRARHETARPQPAELHEPHPPPDQRPSDRKRPRTPALQPQQPPSDRPRKRPGANAPTKSHEATSHMRATDPQTPAATHPPETPT